MFNVYRMKHEVNEKNEFNNKTQKTELNPRLCDLPEAGVHYQLIENHQGYRELG